MTTELKSPPHSPKAEEGVLGSILLDPTVIDKVSISSKAFFDNRNKVLMSALLEMRGRNMQMDALTIAEHLKNTGKLSEVGGYERLSDLQEATLVPSHIVEYADIVKEKCEYRQLIESGIDIMDKSYSCEMSPDHIRGDALSKLIKTHKEEDKELHTLGDEFVDECKVGNVGHLPWWCNEWTAKMGKLDDEIFILHAERSTGKTALMLQWVTELYKNGYNTPVASIETKKKRLIPRIIANVGSLNTFRMRSRGHITHDEERKARQAIQRIRGFGINIRDGSATMSELKLWAYAEAAKGKRQDGTPGIDGVWIDNLLSISDADGNWESKTKFYDFCFREFRDMRDNLKCPIFIVAHPNAEGKVAWSKDAENFADIIKYLKVVPDEGTGSERCGHIQHINMEGKHVAASLQKSRDGIQPIGNLDFIGETQTFRHHSWAYEA